MKYNSYDPDREFDVLYKLMHVQWNDKNHSAQHVMK